MARRSITMSAATVAAVALAACGPLGGSTSDQTSWVPAGSFATGVEVRLSTEGPSVAELVAVVREHARRTPGADPTAPVTVILTSDLAEETGDDRALLGGLRRGSYAWVRTDLAWPERTLVHEVAHVLTDGDGHGPIWRGVYLGATEQLFGEYRAERERRRIAWVHDRCYRTDTCASRASG
jgi:antitoxin (DNA-binding transcriptional repressor) of toxin-antitoxin stability system